MRAMGELLLSNLNYKSFSDFSAELLGPWAGFLVSWTYWFCCVITAIAEIVAITANIGYWAPDFPPWLTSLFCILLLLTLNLVSVSLFGETEFWFAIIKIIAIIILVIIAFKTPAGHIASLTHLMIAVAFFFLITGSNWVAKIN